jgi:hypothetical protein
MLNKEEQELIEKWRNTPIEERKYTRDIIELCAREIFKNYKDPTEKLTLKGKEEFNKLMKEQLKEKPHIFKDNIRR